MVRSFCLRADLPGQPPLSPFKGEALSVPQRPTERNLASSAKVWSSEDNAQKVVDLADHAARRQQHSGIGRDTRLIERVAVHPSADGSGLAVELVGATVGLAMGGAPRSS